MLIWWRKEQPKFIVFDNVYAKDTSVDRHAAKFNSRHGYGRLRVIGTKTDNYFVKRGNVLNLGYSKKNRISLDWSFIKRENITSRMPMQLQYLFRSMQTELKS